MTDFWRRWHMTLSRWFRDYVYIPLGGSKGTPRQTIRNLWFVFLLTGAWHGAAWTFILWGVYNGSLLVLERVSGTAAMDPRRLAVPRRTVTFLLVVAGWVMFRANSPGEAVRFYVGMIPTASSRSIHFSRPRSRTRHDSPWSSDWPPCCCPRLSSSDGCLKAPGRGGACWLAREPSPRWRKAPR